MINIINVVRMRFFKEWKVWDLQKIAILILRMITK
jgi:hypothetical protein